MGHDPDPVTKRLWITLLVLLALLVAVGVFIFMLGDGKMALQIGERGRTLVQ